MASWAVRGELKAELPVAWGELGLARTQLCHGAAEGSVCDGQAPQSSSGSCSSKSSTTSSAPVAVGGPRDRESASRAATCRPRSDRRSQRHVAFRALFLKNRSTAVHKDVPELLQMLEHLVASSPVRPGFRVSVQRCLGGSDRRRVYHSVTSDSSGDSRDRWSPKLGRQVPGGQAKPAVPGERYSVPSAEFLQTTAGCGALERRRRFRRHRRW